MDPPLGELVQTSQLHGPLCEEEEQQPNCWDFACADVVSGRSCLVEQNGSPVFEPSSTSGMYFRPSKSSFKGMGMAGGTLGCYHGWGAAKNPVVHLDDTPSLLIRSDICGKTNVRNIDKNLVEGPKPVLIDPNTHIGRRLARNRVKKSSVMETNNY